MNRVLTIIPIAALAALAIAAPAGAETFEPTRFDDPKPGLCKPANCSLREAVLAANKGAGRTVIELERGTYQLEIEPTGGSPAPKSGDLNVVSPASIRGEGAKRTTIVGGGLDRLFHLGSADENDSYALSRFTLRGGLPAEGSDPEIGGGILALSAESVRLDRVSIESNRALSRGAGIFAYDSGLKLDRTKVVRNFGPESGGGIWAAGSTLAVSESTIEGNVADFGGGLYLPDSNAETSASFEASTVSSNRAAIGGGVMLDDDDLFGGEVEPSLRMLNSTVADNDATVSGGGISAIQGASVTLDNVTVSHNGADTDDAGGGAGGGIHQSSGATVAIGDSLIAANQVGSTGIGKQCSGTFSSLGGNGVQEQPAGICTLDATPLGVAPVASLARNGGPTRTAALVDGPAVGLALSCPAQDQRGELRPPTGCDWGAFEREG